MSGSRKVDTDQLSSLQWSFLPPMRTQREGGAAVSLGNDMVAVVGGYHVEQKFLKTCAAYHGGQWKSLPDMKTNRMGCGACADGGRTIVVAGGFQRGRTYLNTAEMLDITTLQWQTLPSMRISRAGCAAVSLGDGIVVVLGGWKDADTAVDTVERLDLSTGQWTLLPSMLTARAGCSAVSVNNNKIVVMGGYSNYGYCLSSAEVFDVTTQTWSALPSMKERRDASAACVVGNCVMVFGGGESSTKPSRGSEILNMDATAAGWAKLPPLKCARFGCGAAAMGNKVAIMGGRGTDGQHLDSVECITLPMLDDGGGDEAPDQEEARVEVKQSEEKTSTEEKEDESAETTPVPEEWKRMVDATLQMAEEMMKKDKARSNESYERAKQQAMDECEYKVKEVDKRLKSIELERKRLVRAKSGALRRRDEKLLEIEEQRRQALTQIEKHFRPLLARAANSSAPEYFAGDGQSSFSSLNSAADATAPSVEEEEEPPPELLCSITGNLMVDPVTAVDGHTYEREAIEAWFKRFKVGDKPTSPMTNEKLTSRRLIPSYNIRSQCQTWLAKGGSDSEASVQEVQSCVEPRQVRSSSSSARHRSSSNRSARRAHHHRSNRQTVGRSSSTSRARRSSDPASPLGRSFTLFGRSAPGLAVTRRPSR